MTQTASQYVKSHGLPSVAYVARKINKHPQRLFEWYHGNFALFEAVVAGVFAKNFTDEVLLPPTPKAKFKHHIDDTGDTVRTPLSVLYERENDEVKK